jgi:4-aminobutyrate aminotransferase-like enzyme
MHAPHPVFGRLKTHHGSSFMTDTQALLKRRKASLGSGAPLFYDEPLQIVSGKGVWVEDTEGRRYLDVYNNVPHVGHCHPHVVEAICRQVATLNLNTRYLHDNVVTYAERLARTVDFAPAAAMFTCTGTEANELALRMARFVTGNQGIIVSSFSYHGNSQLLASVTTCFSVPETFPDYARAVPVPDPFLDSANRSPEDLARDFADKVAEAVASLEASGHGVAALLFDASFANEGLPRLVPDYLRQAVGHVRAAGGLFIADEVQGGFGRTGKTLWAHQAHGVVADIVTMGKPMGNGHPVAGIIAPLSMVEAFEKSAIYFNTFGGNPVSAAAGLAVLDVIERENLVVNARTLGSYVEQGLLALQERHAVIGDVRTRGMFFGLNLVEDRATKAPATQLTKRLVNRMKELGVLIGRIGPHDNILKMRPSMVFQNDHADILLDTLDRAFTEVQ